MSSFAPSPDTGAVINDDASAVPECCFRPLLRKHWAALLILFPSSRSLPMLAYISNLDDRFHEGLVSALCGTGFPHPMDWQSMDANERAAFISGEHACDAIIDVVEYIETLRWPDD